LPLFWEKDAREPADENSTLQPNMHLAGFVLPTKLPVQTHENHISEALRALHGVFHNFLKCKFKEVISISFYLIDNNEFVSKKWFKAFP